MNLLTRHTTETGASTVIFNNFSSGSHPFTPTLEEFKKVLHRDGTFVTPEREYEVEHFMEMLTFSAYKDAFDELQMKALVTGQRTPMKTLIENAVALSKLMNEFAVEYYKQHILPDYECEYE